MQTIPVKERQNLLDLAVQHTGTVEQVIALALANDLSLTESLAPGRQLQPVAVGNKAVVAKMVAEGIEPATGTVVPQGGIGFMGIEIDFKVL